MGHRGMWDKAMQSLIIKQQVDYIQDSISKTKMANFNDGARQLVKSSVQKYVISVIILL